MDRLIFDQVRNNERIDLIRRREAAKQLEHNLHHARIDESLETVAMTGFSLLVEKYLEVLDKLETGYRIRDTVVDAMDRLSDVVRESVLVEIDRLLEQVIQQLGIVPEAKAEGGTEEDET